MHGRLSHVDAKRLRRCLGKLTASSEKKPPSSLSSSGRAAGHSLKDISEALETERLNVSYHTFHVAVRAQRKPTKNSERQLLSRAEVGLSLMSI